MPTHQLLHTSITIEASYANSRTFDVYYRIDMLDAFRFTVGFYFFMENLVSSVRLLTEIGALTKSEKRNYESIRVFVPSFKRTPLHGHLRPHRRTLSVRTNIHEQSVLTNTAVRTDEHWPSVLANKTTANSIPKNSLSRLVRTVAEGLLKHDTTSLRNPSLRVLSLYEFRRSAPGQLLRADCPYRQTELCTSFTTRTNSDARTFSSCIQTNRALHRLSLVQQIDLLGPVIDVGENFARDIKILF